MMRDMETKPTLLVADCPRCPARKITFDVTAHVFLRRNYNWQTWHEMFCICRSCHRPSIFVLALNVDGYRTKAGEAVSNDAGKVLSLGITLNDIFDIEGFISLKDREASKAPEHTPPDVAACFDEAAKCRAIRCYNAAGTMFRLALDIATRPLLPLEDATAADQPNKRQRRDLGLRIPWLIEHKRLPAELADLANCIREDGNDGAHQGLLSQADADDLMDFTEALFERLYTEPEKLRLAAERRAARRGGT